jgi:hypothetical protein
MQRKVVSFLVQVMLLAAGCGAAFWTWTLARHVDLVERTGRETSARIDHLETLLDEVADQELIYVAGRFDRETLERSSTVLEQIAAESGALLEQALVASAPATQALSERSAAIAEIHGRALQNLHAGVDERAADLFFTETHTPRRAMQRELRSLRAAESAAAATARSADVKQAWAALAVVALLYAWALIRWSRFPVAPVVNTSLASVLPDTLAPPHEEPVPTATQSLQLEEAADLCSAIGRLKADAELPMLLERTATLLGASGVVVWMAAGEELFAAATHGYDARQVSGLGPIGRSAGNATAHAWRSGRLQAVAGDSSSRGAIVAPMLGSDRCIGVLAIEVVPGREADSTTRSVATLIAAQLSAVLVAWPAGSSASPASAASAPATEVLPFERAAGVST